MPRSTSKIQIEDQLPRRLVDALYIIADKYRGRGIRLFIFGSFATSQNRSNSDLDIGIEWKGERSEDLYRQIRSDIWDLPTVRKIDLVDLNRVSEKFAEETRKHRVYL